jgi:hypothetical protein
MLKAKITDQIVKYKSSGSLIGPLSRRGGNSVTSWP